MKIPQVYEVAATILRQYTERKASLKSLIYKSEFENLRQLFALLHEVVKNAQKIELLIGSGILQDLDCDEYLIKLILYDVIIKSRRIPSSHPAVKAITKSRKELLTLLSQYNENETDNTISVPRYVRVNTLKMTVGDAIKYFSDEGWIQVETPEDYETFLKEVKNISEDQFLIDFHLEYLLVFHGKTDFHDHELVKNGSLLLQDKASCLSAVALNPKKGSHVIDACAAPGMKTTLLAALMENDGCITAIDRNKERSVCLSNFVNTSGATCVTVRQTDFLMLKPEEFPEVKYILVDPSCSGSGIVRRVNEQPGKDVQRLKKLSNFQSTILKHAFTFPNVKHVVYSTCSVHNEENECVVKDVMRSVGEKFKVKTVLKNWPSRGSEDFSFGRRCVSASPESDLTNGFFIAGFVRKKNRN